MALTCPQTGKHVHWSKGEAEAHLRNLKELNGYVGHVFICPHCSCWHVGREKKNAHKNKFKE